MGVMDARFENACRTRKEGKKIDEPFHISVEFLAKFDSLLLGVISKYSQNSGDKNSSGLNTLM